MGIIYDDLISINRAPVGTSKIGVYTEDGKRIGKINIPNTLAPSELGEKLYSFGALSDVHVVYDTGTEDFQKALSYLNESEDVAFTCISGDLTQYGTEAQLAQYKAIVDEYSPDTSVYAAAGNHEYYDTTSRDFLETYTGNPLYYSFTYGDDVFIILGIISGNQGNLFDDGELQWLYETLEENRNKRCFLFEHVPFSEGCGDAFNLYPYTKMSNSSSYNEDKAFYSLLSHYSNVIFFHGHTHMKFRLQYGNKMANYDYICGCHSIHIPSLAIPRDVDESETSYSVIYADSEGYVVDVYENGIMLRGRDFVKEKFLPIATYYLDTTLKEIGKETYVDSTGTINTTGEDGSEAIALVFNEGYMLNSAINTEGFGDITTSNAEYYAISDLIDLEDGYDYKVYGTGLGGGMSCYPIYYNANGGFLAKGSTSDCWSTSTGTGDLIKVLNPPDGAKYLRLQGYTGSDTSVMVSKVSMKRVPNEDTVYNAYEITWSVGDKLSKTTGEVEETGTSYSASDFIELDKFNTVNVPQSSVSTYCCSVIYYDSNKTFISYAANVVSNDNEDISYTITPPDGAIYIRLRCYTSAYVTGAYNKYKLIYLL